MSTYHPDRAHWQKYIKETQNKGFLLQEVQKKKIKKSKIQYYCIGGERIIKSDCNNRALVFYTGTKTRIGIHIENCQECQILIDKHIAILNKPKVEPVRKIVLNSIASVHLRRKGVRMDWIRGRLNNVTGEKEQ